MQTQRHLGGRNNKRASMMSCHPKSKIQNSNDRKQAKESPGKRLKRNTELKTNQKPRSTKRECRVRRRKPGEQAPEHGMKTD